MLKATPQPPQVASNCTRYNKMGVPIIKIHFESLQVGRNYTRSSKKWCSFPMISWDRKSSAIHRNCLPTSGWPLWKQWRSLASVTPRQWIILWGGGTQPPATIRMISSPRTHGLRYGSDVSTGSCESPSLTCTSTPSPSIKASRLRMWWMHSVWWTVASSRITY